MKRTKRVPIILLALVLSIGMAMPAFAASETKDGLEVTLMTDKDEYGQNEQIVATLTVTNTNKKAVSNVSLENVVPKGYKLADGSEATKQLESLGAGETVSLEVVYLANASNGDGTVPGTENTDPGKGENLPDSEVTDSKGEQTEPANEGNTSSKDETKNTGKTGTAGSVSTLGNTGKNSSAGKTGSTPRTGDESDVMFWAVLFVLSGVGIATVLAVRKKKRKKILSLFLCVALAGSVITGAPIKANAEESDISSINVGTTVSVDGTIMTIGAIVKYGMEIENDEGLPKPENPSEADEYYWSNSTVIEVINVPEAADVMTEAEAVLFFHDRGFTDYPVTYEYSISGDYYGEIEAQGDSSSKHPMYQTYFISDDGDFWTVFIVDGKIFANPASFNLESDLGAQLLFSESNTLTSYNDSVNKFYVTIPYETAVITKTIERVDAETLNKLTTEEIAKL